MVGLKLQEQKLCNLSNFYHKGVRLTLSLQCNGVVLLWGQNSLNHTCLFFCSLTPEGNNMTEKKRSKPDGLVATP